MKRLLILLMALGLMAGSVATAEAKRQSRRVERTVEGSYRPYPTPITGCNEPLGSWACLIVETRGSEAFFTARVTDAHGQPVAVDVFGGGRLIATFCGETAEAISFPAGTTLEFDLGAGRLSSLDCPTHRVKTTGTISVTLSSSRPPEPKPVRSGRLVTGSGWLLDATFGGCQTAPDCALWMQNDCDPSLAGRDPGVTASIVDLRGVAGTQRRFEFGPGEPWTPVWGGAQVQFWNEDCTELRTMRWRSTNCDRDDGGICYDTRFRIPASARWMTVTGHQDDVGLAWTLT